MVFGMASKRDYMMDYTRVSSWDCMKDFEMVMTKDPTMVRKMEMMWDSATEIQSAGMMVSLMACPMDYTRDSRMG